MTDEHSGQEAPPRLASTFVQRDARSAAGVEEFPPTEIEPGLLPPDPDEVPPIELWSAVGDIPPWGTVLVLLALSAVFAAQAARGEIGETSALISWGASVTGTAGFDAAWRLLASTLIHGGGIHLFLNTISLLMFGPAVEAIFARPGFWLIYAAGGAAASQGSLLWRAFRHGGVSISVGASGAIFALAGALLLAAFRLRRRLAPSRARALAGAMLFLIVQSIAGAAVKHGTDNAAHAVGLLAGAAIGCVAPLEPRLSGRAPGFAIRLAGTLAALALVAAFAYSMRSGLAGR